MLTQHEPFSFLIVKIETGLGGTLAEAADGHQSHRTNRQHGEGRGLGNDTGLHRRSGYVFVGISNDRAVPRGRAELELDPAEGSRAAIEGCFRELEAKVVVRTIEVDL